MKPAAERLRERLEAIEVRKPMIRVVHNRFVESFDDPARIRQALVEQLCNPVRWIETIQFFGRKGVTRVVECGPGKVLTGLSKRIVTDIEYIALNDSAALAAASAQA
jgi:[acyl-carrier-protein] S-malonyltransferase